MTAADLIVLALAVYRGTHLLVRDEITRPWRDRLAAAAERRPPGCLRNRLTYGALCPWCLSVWLAAAGWLALRYGHGWAFPCASVLAVAGVAGLLLDRDRS